MASIFGSHSAKDQDLVNFFNKCRGTAKVGVIWEEIEKIIDGYVSADKIKADINQSNAVFIILSLNVENTPHTRDWVTAESGAANNKDTWVFERASDLGHISIVIPFTRHYVLYEPVDDFIPYIHDIIRSYDDSHILPTTVIGGGIGALSGKAPLAIAGAIAGALFARASSPTRPQGLLTICQNCYSSYCVHLFAEWQYFRCPICNTILSWQTGLANA
jgi:hypothetical protein